MNMIAVVGMHRSGTSCLAGILEHAGVFFGNVSRSNAYNKKGNIENSSIMELNDSVLMSNNSAWNKPIKGSLHWSDDQYRQLRDIILGYPQYRTCGFKDPRTLLTLGGWLEAIPSIRFIGTIRNPVDVASSLNYREDMLFEEAMNLWKVYNQKLLQLHRDSAFPIVDFNQGREEYTRQVNKAMEHHGLEIPHTDGPSFFEESLRHYNSNNYDVPVDVKNLYDNLREVANDH